MPRARRYWRRVSGSGQVLLACVERALLGGRLEADAAALVAAGPGSGKFGTPFERMHWLN